MERYTIKVNGNFISIKDNVLGDTYKGEAYKKDGKTYVKANTSLAMKMISKHWNKVY